MSCLKSMSSVFCSIRHTFIPLALIPLIGGGLYGCAQTTEDSAQSDQIEEVQANATAQDAEVLESVEADSDANPEANCQSEAVLNSTVLEALCITTDDQFTSTGEAASETAAAEVEPAQPQDIWARILDMYQLDLTVEHKRIDAQLKWYAKHPKYMNRVAKRANRYLFHVVEELEKRNLPGELAFLPIVESAFDPFAYSHGRAAGMWQFIPSTGRMYGLKQDWWLDERRDIRQSTEAAVKYLAALNRQFKGDWLHALAAYNAGSGNVSKAIRKNKKKGKPTDFWSLRLPKETQAYVPKLIALAKLMKDREHYGLTIPSIPNEPHFAAVDTKGQIDLANAADLAGITIDELYLLNPQFNRWSSSPDGPFELLVPVDKAENFKAELANLPPENRLQWVRYKIKEGDVLGVIAQKHNTTTKAIKVANNIRGHNIRAGKTILIPVPSKGTQSYSLSASNRLASKQAYLNKKYSNQKIYHNVKSGDSFWEIAKKYKVNVRKLAKWNGMAPTDTLAVGKKLVVWLPSKEAAKYNTGKTRKVHYTVRNGDNLSSIAQRFNVSVANIKKWNRKVSGQKYLQPKQRLVLYVKVTHGTNPNLGTF